MSRLLTSHGHARPLAFRQVTWPSNPNRSSIPKSSASISRNFTLPGRRRGFPAQAEHWADRISSGQADKLKETELLPIFLTDIFVNLLGYTGPVGAGDTYTISRENLVEVDGQYADAVLGRFRQNKRVPNHRRHRRERHPRPAGNPLRRAENVRRGSMLPLRHQSPVRLDSRHLHAGNPPLSQGLEPADLRALRHRPAGERCRLAQALRLPVRRGPRGPGLRRLPFLRTARASPRPSAAS